MFEEMRRTGAGVLLAIRGRRRAGKSRLVNEWCKRQGVRHVFYESTRERHEGAELALFAQEAARSTLAAAPTLAGVTPQSWEAAFTLIASHSTREEPSVIVLDEFPYLFQSEPNIDAVIQKIWDRHLDKKAPVFLILIGSDLHMMEQLAQYDRPLFGRGREMVVQPLSPADIADMSGLAGADALDAYLICGGFPMLAERWRRGESIWTYLEQELTPTAALIVNGERMLSAEFPTEAQARLILEVIGSGETTFKNISQKAGVNSTGVTRAIDILSRKRAIEVMTPVSAEDTPRNTRYVVADSYLRFWLRFIGPSLGEIERGRADLVFETIRQGWQQYRGQAIEPLVRQGLMRTHPPFPRANYVGAYWTRTNDVQVDLVGVERERGNTAVEFVGSIKWREDAPLDASDVARLARDRLKVPGATEETPMIAVSRSGFGEVKSLTRKIGPDDLIAAFR
jgi:uncharacterized protein